jgi:hypothetical protein
MCRDLRSEERNARGDTAERSFEPITEDDLLRLRHLARTDRDEMFRRSEHWAKYRGRLLCVALCQGAAQHWLDGVNGVKDFDVWTVFAAVPDRYPDVALYRRRKAVDFGPSHFGVHPADVSRIEGRRVDLLSDSIKVESNVSAVPALQNWLRTERRGNPRHLGKQAVVLFEPELGRLVWPAGTP